MDYTTLSLAEVKTGLEDIAREVQETFGELDARQLNWRPDATQWSVGQCLDHLVMLDYLMFRAAGDALNGAQVPTIWHRVPGWPRLMGRLLIRSLSPDARRKQRAPARSRPATSDVAADIVQRFAEQHRDTAAWVHGVNEREAARVIMTSPFSRFVAYSVLDGCRLVVAHDRRHFEQARRVTQLPGFPR
jgi:hypothetical protein